MQRQKGKKSAVEGSHTKDRVQEYSVSHKSWQWQFLKVLPDPPTKAKVDIFSICTLPLQELINLGSDLTMMEDSAGRTGYLPSCCTQHQGPPVSHSLWEVGEHLVKFTSCRHHWAGLCSFCLFEMYLSLQHSILGTSGCCIMNWAESKNQATHVELWEATCAREKQSQL